MAQASSAQREPSMEEILASIRRIIEDSDQGKKPAELEQQGRFETAGERNEGAVIEVDAFRAELRGRMDRDQAPRLPDPASRDDAIPVATAGVAPEIVQDAASAYRSGPAYDAEPPAGGAGALAYREPLPTETQEVDDGIVDEPKAGLHQVQPAPSEGIGQPSFHEPSHQSPKPAIISEQAGRQVAAAFGELSEAFAASRRKSFDEMAEEMLRPMLQDWLDNNLPTLVERLVREEIERVARGG